jgi:hypothetical protein
MNSRSILAVLLFTPILCNSSQCAELGTTNLTTASNLVWAEGTKTGNSTEHIATEVITNADTGTISSRIRRYVSLGTGLNYLDENNQWQSSQDLIELSPNGAVAARGPTKVHFGANINAADAITITSSNRTFRTSPLGLYYFDASTGKSALISSIQDSTGQLLPPNRILYTNVMGSIRADLTITYTKGATESDLILQQRPKPPEWYGLSSDSTRLELWHGLNSDAGPKRSQRVIESLSSDSVSRSQLAEPDLIEETLDFGNIWFPQGRAFFSTGSTENEPNVPIKVTIPSSRDTNGVLTAKRLFMIDNSPVLVESVPWKKALPQLQSLPEVAARNKKANKEALFARRQLPSRSKTKTGLKGEIRLAKGDYKPKGWALDWIAITGSGDYTFSNGHTYYADSYVYLNGTVNFDGGLIKLAPWASIIVYGPTIFNTNSSSAFTSRDDDLAGDTLPDSTHVPDFAASPALWLYYVAYAPAVFSISVSWAHTALELDTISDPASVSSSAFYFCVSGLSGNSGISVTDSGKCCVFYDTDGLSDMCGSDANVNGFPDLYEYEHFGNLNQTGAGDFDGDGVSNMTEYRQGRNPAIAGTLSDTNNLIQLRVFTPLK